MHCSARGAAGLTLLSRSTASHSARCISTRYLARWAAARKRRRLRCRRLFSLGFDLSACQALWVCSLLQVACPPSMWGWVAALIAVSSRTYRPRLSPDHRCEVKLKEAVAVRNLPFSSASVLAAARRIASSRSSMGGRHSSSLTVERITRKRCCTHHGADPPQHHGQRRVVQSQQSG